MDNKNSKNITNLINIKRKSGYCEREGDCRFSSLSGDGSDRSFFRIKTAEDTSLIGVLPTHGDSQKADKGKAEALASYNIGKHLQSRGIPVPEIIDFDPQSGAILFEDLGVTLLHDILPGGSQENTISWPAAKDIYMEIVETLLFMQISGSVRFSRKWCWDTQRYDKKLMLEKESGYNHFAGSYWVLKILHQTWSINSNFWPAGPAGSRLSISCIATSSRETL